MTRKKLFEITKRFAMILDEQTEKDLLLVMKSSGARTYAEGMRHAVAIASKKLVPTYSKEREENKPKREYFSDPIERIKAQQEREKEKAALKKALEEEEQLKLCNALDGTLEKQENGNYMCQWKIYTKVGKRVNVGTIGKSLSLLYPELLETQYRNGTKEEIIELLKKQESAE